MPYLLLLRRGYSFIVRGWQVWHPTTKSKIKLPKWVDHTAEGSRYGTIKQREIKPNA